MAKVKQTGERRQQILESLAKMLEECPGSRITIAGLAAQVGVSEAALYRHFPSKTKIFEGLIEFIEDTIFSRVTIIIDHEKTAADQCEKILTLLLTFTERNPGMSRILTGDVLAGETDRLRQRIAQFYNRIETQLRQIMREAELREGIRPTLSVQAAANVLLAVAEGRISQFVRSNFNRPPTMDWQDQWHVLMQGFFKKTMSVNLS